MTDLEEFELMCGFLETSDPEIHARDAAPLTDPDRQLLIRIALGEASDSDRTQAVSMLCDNSTALEFLAQQLHDN
ncbi:MAG: hypothetical protein AAF585_12580 [Verrucomicrobiota bacterium]